MTDLPPATLETLLGPGSTVDDLVDLIDDFLRRNDPQEDEPPDDA